MKRLARLSVASSGLAVLCAALPSCSGPQEASGTLAINSPPETDSGASSDATISMPCVQDKGDIGEASKKYSGGAEAFGVTTNWCFSPKKAEAVRVLFIIDRSGS